MRKISSVLVTLLKDSSSARCVRIQISVYACEQPLSVYMRAHRASMFICSHVCMCVAPGSLCERS